MRQPPRNGNRALVYLGTAIAWLVGCQVIVSSDVPDFACEGTEPGNCPHGMTCDVENGRCTSDADAGRDVTSPEMRDTSTSDRPVPPPRLGQTCASAVDCPGELFCGTASVLTTEVVGESGESLCTKTCCTSSDCPDTFVCLGAGTGGNYCVAAARAQREALGPNLAGAACESSPECRSGLCEDGRCVDSCCVATDCASGSVCRKTTVAVPPPKKQTWACAAPIEGATIASGTICVGADAGSCATGTCCENQNCAGPTPRICRPPCCSPNDCTTAGGDFAACTVEGIFASPDNRNPTKFCWDRDDIPATATAQFGEFCGTNHQKCASLVCDTDSTKCSTACCQDKDCPPDYVCRPASTGILRCVQKTD